MSFEVAPGRYDNFMGRFSAPLASVFADWAELPRHGPVLDVGCGTGALTAVLVRRYGESEVFGIEPSSTFFEATTARFPRAEILKGTAEHLPFDDGRFGGSLAALVVHFMTDPAAGIAEMVRVTRRGGVVAACVWDNENGRSPYTPFMRAARAETGASPGPLRAGTRRGDLRALLEGAGCGGTEDGEVTVGAEYDRFDTWWATQVQATGSAAAALDGLDAAGIERVRVRALEELGDGPFIVNATAWVARGVVG